MSYKRLTSDHPSTTQSIGTTTIKLMIRQQVANTLATYEPNWNNAYEQGRTGNNNHRNNSDVPRACTYEEFMNYKPRTFYDNEGIIGITLWFENMKSILYVSSCIVNYRVKFATCTCMDTALT